MSKKRFLVVLVLVFGIGLIVLVDNVKAITHDLGFRCAGENQPCGLLTSCCGTLSCVPNEGQLFDGTCKLTQSSLQEPLNNGGLHVKIDIKKNELFAFRFVDGSNCLIKLEEEDDYSGNEKRDVNGNNGGAISHKSGSLSMAAPDAYCPNRPGDDECEVFRKAWGSIKDRCGEDGPKEQMCELSESYAIYRPKVDLLCADGKWYLCSREYHAEQNRLFKKGDNAFVCTKDNEWKKATEICDNEKDDDGDGKTDCGDENCYSKNLNDIVSGTPGKHTIKEFYEYEGRRFEVPIDLYYHSACDPDSKKEVCEGEGPPTISFNKPKYGFEQGLSTNKCCGDDVDDNGKIVGGFLCSVDADGSGQWIKASESKGKIIYHNKLEYVSDGTNWVKCDKTFQDDNKNIKNIDGKDYFCTGKGEDSIVVCCGDNQECKSETDGKRIATGQSIKAAIQTQDSGNPTIGSVVYDISSITGRVSNDDRITPDCDINGVCEAWESSETCRDDCPIRPIGCGNNICNNNENNDNCPQDCEPNCGNNICDSGENNNNCQKDCKQESNCGDNALDTGEECDVVSGETKFRSSDGSKILSDNLCTSYDSSKYSGGNLICENCVIKTTGCQPIPGVCGNGIVDADKGEDCDDGNTIDDGNGCSADCKRVGSCGDGRIQSLFEECDGNNLNNKVCKDVGDFDSGELRCNVCKFDTSRCTKSRVGETAEGKVETFYCKSDFKFVADLDTPNSQSTCEKAGFKWTGTKCCSEDDDNLTASTLREFYNDPDGAGGCWNSTFIRSVDYAHNYSVISYNGLFYGCAIDISNVDFKERFGIEFQNFDKRNDGFPELTDKFSREKLITGEGHCANKEIKNQNGNVIGFYYCAYPETWNYSSIKKDNLSIAPITISDEKLQAGCCGNGACWNGSVCLENQTGKPTQLPHIRSEDKQYRCIDGAWKDAATITKKSPDGADGYCPKETQCLYRPDSTNVAEQCIESGEYRENNFCENGLWTSRTKLIASKLLELVGTNDFTLFCDNKENTLNYLAYRIGNKDVTNILNTDLKANNFCVLNTNNKVILATSLNEDISQKLRNLLPVLGINAQTCTRQDALNDDGNYHACNNGNKLLINKKLNSFIYNVRIPSTVSSLFDSLILAPFKVVIVKVRSFVKNDNAFMLLENTPRFERLYASRTGSKTMIGTLQGTDYKTAVLEYKEFSTDICNIISQFYAVQIKDEESGISCKKEVIGGINSYYVIAQGSESVNFNPENIWLDLTSKLRVS